MPWLYACMRRFIDSGVILCKAGALKYFLAEAYLGTLQLKFDYPQTIYRHWDDQQCVCLLLCLACLALPWHSRVRVAWRYSNFAQGVAMSKQS